MGGCYCQRALSLSAMRHHLPFFGSKLPVRASRTTRLLALLAIGLVSSLAYNRLQASAPLRIDALPVVNLQGLHRLLIIAPHPDDETLGAGGVIQAAVAAGAEVHVVVVTNGDGQWAAPLALHGRFRARPEDYIALGVKRQAETLAALAAFGLSASEVNFLGFPDGDLQRLWQDDWTSACPFTARLTRTSSSPYVTTYDPQAQYCGRDVLNALTTIVTQFAPDVVVLPHPQDEHPDHRAASAFARLALAHWHQAEPSFEPQVLGYLVHHGDFPQPRGWRMARPLLPPSALVHAGADWQRFDLSSDQIFTKAAAVRAHASQDRLLGSFLPSFVRPNELFDALALTDTPLLEWAALPELGPLAWHTILEPARESSRRLVLEGADLIALEAARFGDQLWLTAIARGPLLPGLRYQFLVKLPTGQTLTLPLMSGAIRSSRASFGVQLDLVALDQPTLLAVAAESRQGATLDRTAWHLLALGVPAGEPVVVASR